MNKRAIRGLIGLNALLALCLAAVTFSSSVTAQQPARAPGDYTMVAGVVQGNPASVIYIVDGTNQELVAVTWDQSRKRLTDVGYRDLASDAKAAKRSGR